MWGAAVVEQPDRRLGGSGAMPLIYSFVARGNTVLADYTSFTGNFSVVAIQVGRGGVELRHGRRFWSGRASLGLRTERPLALCHLVMHVPHRLCRRWRRAHRETTPSSRTLATGTVSLEQLFVSWVVLACGSRTLALDWGRVRPAPWAAWARCAGKSAGAACGDFMGVSVDGMGER